MALDPKIASIKAAGTYRFEFDKSQVVGVPSNQIRLVVGFSKKGPFNTPVFVPDSAFFKQVFGDIDRNLEKKDSFFQRSCLTALERGPILALNLLSLDDLDKVDYVKFGTSCTPDVQENLAQEGIYSRFYNQDKFWYPDSNAFLNLTGADPNTLSSTTTNDLLNFVNLGKSPMSVIIRKAAAANVAGFNVTVENWYGTANVPGYLNKSSLVSDFMVDVFIIEGNFGGDFSLSQPYSRFSADPVFQDFFSPTKGLQRRRFQSDSTDTQMQEFFNLTEVNVVATYTASLLPDFVDLVGNNLFIEKLINADTASTGMFCAVNEELFSGDFLIDGVAGGIDLIGHNIEYKEATSSQNDINFLSYQDTIVADLTATREAVTAQDVTVATGDSIAVTTPGGNILIQVQGTVGEDLYDAFASMFANTASALGSYILDPIDNVYVPVKAINITPTTVSVTLSSVGTNATHFHDTVGTTYTYVNPVDLDMVVQMWDALGSTYKADIIGSYGTTLYTQFANGSLTDGDEAVYLDSLVEYHSYLVSNEVSYPFIHIGPVTGSGTVVQISDPAYYLPAVQITPYEEDTFTNPTDKSQFSLQGTGVFLDTNGDPVAANTLDIQTLKGSLNLTFDIISDYTTDTGLKANQVLILSDVNQASSIVVGNYLLNDEGLTTGHSRLTRINQVIGGLTTAQYSTIPVGKTALLVTCQNEISVTTEISGTKKVELYYPIDRWVDYLNIFTFNGFNLDPTKHVPNGTNDRQNEILNGTLSGTNLYNALTDRDVINFRYVIDTFGNGIESGSKAIYTNLCADRKNAFAIINAPSAKDFKTNTDPKFTDVTGALSTKFISEGGDLSLNPTIRYSLPSQTQGASWGAFYFPYITVRDLGKNINVPPASYVSNNFIAKYANALPWSLVAGVRRGVVGGAGVVGLELNLDKSDREYLEPFGINPIVFQSGTGPTIFANKTAQQTTKSALSSINVREVVIYIQDGIEAILKNYLFEFNTAQTRLEIKTLADNFLSTVQNDDGVYDFRNIMDETNNTPEVIDQNVGILDTYIEPVRGMEILVQRTTILRTGAISTGNFQ